MLRRVLIIVALLIVAGGVGLWYSARNQHARLEIAAMQGPLQALPAPRTGFFPTLNIAKAIGWKKGEMPTAAAGLTVKPFAAGLDHPRWLLPLANGDVLVAESDAPPKPDDTRSLKGKIQRLVMSAAGAGGGSPNRIVLLRDADGDGVAESRSVLLANLNSPFGLALVGDQLYIANSDALVRVPFTLGQTRIDAAPVKVVDLPGGTINHHWTKNVIASADGRRLFVTVGSNSNVGERGQAVEQGRAAIWEVDPANGHHRIYAYGIRNPNGMAWQPDSGQLWTVVNERDELGSDIVPDYLTAVQFGGFYGWPWYYWGGVVDKRPKDPDVNDLQQYVIKPDYALGAHTASLGLTFAAGEKLGPKYASGVFIGQHGSWNRAPRSGYKVIFVPFAGGKPSGKPTDVLAGFLDGGGQARGRPVGVAIDRTGALLVADDVGNAVWRVAGPQAVAAR